MIDYIVESERPFAGSLPIDEAGRRELAGRIFDRTVNIASSMTNHWILEGGEPLRPRLAHVPVPTLVIHGLEDPLFPYAHGEAMARAIPGAELVGLERAGHELPRAVWDVAVPAILRHTSR